MHKTTRKPKTSVPTRDEALQVAMLNGHHMGPWRTEMRTLGGLDHDEVCVTHCTEHGCQFMLLDNTERVRVGRLLGGLPCPTRYIWPVSAQKGYRHGTA
jgi:hypothetical protein